MNNYDRQNQINVVSVWTKLEQAAELIASTRSSVLWPARGGLGSVEIKHEVNRTLDGVMQDLTELRNYIWGQR